jgi:hypothetical protein
MSEAASIHPEEQKPDHNVVEIMFAPKEVREILAMDDADSIEYLLSRLKHPSIRPADTAFEIVLETTPSEDNPLRQRWSEVVEKSELFASDDYDQYMKDKTLSDLADFMLATRGKKDLDEERSAVRVLMELSATLLDNGHSTHSVHTVFTKMMQWDQ